MPFTGGGPTNNKMSFLTTVPLLEGSLSAYPNPVLDPSTGQPVEIGSIALAKQLIARAWKSGIHSHDLRVRLVAAMQLLQKHGIPLPTATDSGHDAATKKKDPCALPWGPAGGPMTDGSQAPAGEKETDVGGQVQDKLPDSCNPPPDDSAPTDGGDPGVPDPDSSQGEGHHTAPGHQSSGDGHGEGPDDPDSGAGPPDDGMKEGEITGGGSSSSAEGAAEFFGLLALPGLIGIGLTLGMVYVGYRLVERK